MKKIIIIIAFLMTTPNTYGDTLVIKGAGPSAKVVNEFLPLIGGGTSPIKSIKHAGGLEWSDNHLFGRTGRPCTKNELKGRAEIFLATVPMAFGVPSHIGVQSITLQQLRKIYEKNISDWQEITGGENLPIVTIGRGHSESMYLSLKQEYPFFDSLIV